MPRHITMSDLSETASGSIYLVVQVNKATMVHAYSDYQDARKELLANENSALITLKPETIKKVSDGEILEFTL